MQQAASLLNNKRAAAQPRAMMQQHWSEGQKHGKPSKGSCILGHAFKVFEWHAAGSPFLAQQAFCCVPQHPALVFRSAPCLSSIQAGPDLCGSVQSGTLNKPLLDVRVIAPANLQAKLSAQLL